MRISLIVSLFDRNWVLSAGTEYTKDENPATVLDGVDLHAQTEISHPTGFQRNGACHYADRPTPTDPKEA